MMKSQSHGKQRRRVWNGSPSGVPSSEDFAGKQTRWPESRPRSCQRSERDLWPPRWVRERLYESNSTARSAASRGAEAAQLRDSSEKKQKRWNWRTTCVLSLLQTLARDVREWRPQQRLPAAVPHSFTNNEIVASRSRFPFFNESVWTERRLCLTGVFTSALSQTVGNKIDGFEMKERKKCKI